MKENDLLKRLFDYSVSVILFTKSLPVNPGTKVIKYQLIKSSTSSGANYEEAQGGSSKADFVNKTRISLREMRESNYWLRLIKSTEFNIKQENIETLINESAELKNILGAIIKKASSN